MATPTPPKDAKERFSSRVGDYVKFRPTYPPEVIDALGRLAGLAPGWRVADVGSGTGISAGLLLDAGCEVWAVEPNAAMRSAAEARFAGEPRFHSVAASAEATTLADGSMDLALCAQAFHWFDHARARVEFARFLRGRKPVALLWNDRQLGGTPFLDGYERVLREHGTDYAKVSHRNLTVQDDRIKAFFGGKVELFECRNAQRLDVEGLLGRSFSSSYTPAEGTPGRAAMEWALRELFDATHEQGVVTMSYVTQLFVGFVG